MEERFRFVIEFKARVYKDPRGVESPEILARVRRLGEKVMEDNGRVLEVFKLIVTDLLLGDYYSSVLKLKLREKNEAQIILPVLPEMSPEDAEFFKALFTEPLKEEYREAKDNALNLFFSQFENPEIVKVELVSSQ